MITLICVFFPAAASLGLLEAATHTRLPLRQLIYRFCANTIFINLICFLVKKFVLNTADLPLFQASCDMTPAAALNYLLIAIPAAFLVIAIEAVTSRHFQITVEEQP